MRMVRRLSASTLLSGVALSAAVWLTPVQAAENGVGFYLLGSKTVMSGITPPPGLYFQNDVYFNQASANPSKEFPFNGKVAAGIRSTSWLEIPTLLWSTPVQVLGGNLTFSSTVPVGHVAVDAALTLTGPNGGILGQNTRDTNFVVGDPVFGSSIGWHAGDLHWNVGVLINVPVGDYRDGALANLAFHHWGEDLNAGFTWLNSKNGLEISSAVGITFNQMNNATQYKTGDQFHYEGAIIQHLPNSLAFGLVGYHYQQITGDTGQGAVLGPFKGRVSALGGYAGYTFKVQQIPVTASVKVFREFNWENRLNDGVASYVTFAVPLSVASAPASPPKMTK